jgi:hypothetical protein
MTDQTPDQPSESVAAEAPARRGLFRKRTPAATADATPQASETAEVEVVEVIEVEVVDGDTDAAERTRPGVLRRRRRQLAVVGALPTSFQNKVKRKLIDAAAASIIEGSDGVA